MSDRSDSAPGANQPNAPNPLKVGLLVGSPEIGGTERQVAYLAEGLESAGHDVTVFFLSPEPRDGSPTVEFRNRRQVFLGFSATRRVRPLFTLVQQLRRADLDILHMFNLEAMRLGSPAASWARIPVQVGSIRGIRFAHDAQCERRTRAAVHRMAKLTVNSDAIAEQLARKAICPEQKIECIPNGVRMDMAKRVAGNGVARILFAGTLKPVKNPRCFVEACLRLLATGIACQVRVAGDGPLRRELQELVTAAGQDTRFEFLGKVLPEQVPYADSDVVVSTSVREGTSNTLLEAMAHGLAVVGTDSGGTASLMRCGEFGIVVPPDNVNAVAEAIRGLVNDAPLRRQLGTNGARFVHDNFRISAMVDRHVCMYRSLKSNTR